MKYSLATYLLTVTIISFLGFCVENLWLAVTQKYIDNRSMNLPFLLGYGLAVVGIYLIFKTPKKWFSKKPAHKFILYFSYFIVMVVLVSIGEIILGKTVERICGFAYWNYECLPLHITKYTSIPTSIGFAGIIMFSMEFIMEPLLSCVQQLPSMALNLLAVTFTVLLTCDFLVSFRSMYRNKGQNKRWRYEFSGKRRAGTNTII